MMLTTDKTVIIIENFYSFISINSVFSLSPCYVTQRDLTLFLPNFHSFGEKMF